MHSIHDHLDLYDREPEPRPSADEVRHDPPTHEQMRRGAAIVAATGITSDDFLRDTIQRTGDLAHARRTCSVPPRSSCRDW
jgi:hypothetical protein